MSASEWCIGVATFFDKNTKKKKKITSMEGVSIYYNKRCELKMKFVVAGHVSLYCIVFAAGV